MKPQHETELTTLAIDEIEQVHGAGITGGLVKLVTAEDMWGNEMSVEEWMDYMAHHIHTHGDATSTDPDVAWVHDFGN